MFIANENFPSYSDEERLKLFVFFLSIFSQICIDQCRYIGDYGAGKKTQ